MFKKIILTFALCVCFASYGYAQIESLKISEFEVSLNTSGKVANLRDRAMKEATKGGFLRLLKRMTPRYTWQRHDDVLATVDLDRILQKTFIVNEAQNGSYKLIVDLYFDREAVRNVLKNTGIPFTEKSNPKTLMLAVYEGEGRKRVLWEEENPWRDELARVAKFSGLNEIIFPAGDIEEVTKLTPQMATVGAEDLILGLAKNYDATQAVVAKLHVRYGFVGRVVDVEGNVYGNGTVQPFYVRLPYGDDVQLDDVLSQAAESFYARMEEDRQQNTLVEVDRPDRIFLRFHPKNVKSLIDLEQKVKDIDRVRGFKLRVVSIEDSVFQVDFYGDKAKFKRQLEGAGLRVIPTSMAMVWGIEALGVETDEGFIQ